MKIKGHAKIELIDATTGEVKRTVEQDNMVTQFASEIMMDWGFLCRPVSLNYLYGGDSSEYTNTNRIVLDDLFGGIMLFNNKIEQNFDSTGKHNTPLYCPAGTEMIGNGCIDVTNYSQTYNTYLGEYKADQSEDPERTNDSKRTYVYEWGPGRATGNIGTICLTSRSGGFYGAGQKASFNAESNRWEAEFDNTLFQGLRPIQYSVVNKQRHNIFWKGQSYSSANRKFLGAISWAQASQEAKENIYKVCTVEYETGCVICLDKSPAQCLNDGHFKLQWYNLPIRKINPFSDPRDFTFDTLIQEVSIDLRTLASGFPSGGFGSSIIHARVSGSMNSIVIVGITTEYNANLPGLLHDGMTLYAVKIYKENGSWKAKYLEYPNLTGVPNVSVSSYIYRSYQLNDSSGSGGYCYFVGDILDSPFIPQDNQYYNSLIFGGWAVSYDANGNPTYLRVTRNGNTSQVTLMPNLTVNSSGSSGNYYHHMVCRPDSLYGNSYSYIASNAPSDWCFIVDGRVCFTQQGLYWDPITDSYYQPNSYNPSSSVSLDVHPTFDSYSLVQTGLTYYNSNSVISYNVSTLSTFYPFCNWLSTIAVINGDPISKGPLETLRITYTLEFNSTT